MSAENSSNSNTVLFRGKSNDDKLDNQNIQISHINFSQNHKNNNNNNTNLPSNLSIAKVNSQRNSNHLQVNGNSTQPIPQSHRSLSQPQNQLPSEIEEPQQQSKWKKFLIIFFEKKCFYQPSINNLIIIFGVVGLIFMIFGIVISFLNATVVEQKLVKYEDEGRCIPGSGQQDKKEQICYYSFEIEEDMEPPVYMFYSLDKFYQNHRSYMKSKSSEQLKGEDISESKAKDSCDPIVYNKDLWDGIESVEIDGVRKELDPNAVANPCGLIAKSFFNDTYQLYSGENTQTGKKIHINEQGIAWNNDLEQKFKPIKDPSKRDTQWTNVDNEHFIIWMRTSSLPVVRKLWGRIEDNTLEKGQKYFFKIWDNYDVNQYDATKSIVLSTANDFGGKNEFIGWAYIIVGIMCICISFVFILKKKQTGGLFGSSVLDQRGLNNMHID